MSSLGATISGTLSDSRIRAQLESILRSSSFANSERASRFLRHVVEGALRGEVDQLKESVLGVEVFGRKPTYDPRLDAVVRIEAVKLRGRLKEYYETAGLNDPIQIDLPKGGYVPSFADREQRPAPPEPAPQPPLKKLPWFVVPSLAIALCIAAAGSFWYANSRHRVKANPLDISSIAVLPFVDLSAEKDQEYLCDGMAEQIIDSLTKVGGFRVVARSSAFAFKGKQVDIREIGAKLNVRAVLEGSVRRSGNRLRVTAQLNSVADGYHLWSETYERELKDVFTLQDEISRSIVETLQLKLAGNGAQKLLESKTGDMDAYTLYLQGAFHHRKWTAADEIQAIDYFRRSIAADPKYAAPYAGLADTYTWMAMVGSGPADEVMPKARTYATQALALSPKQAPAHISLGFVKAFYDHDWDGAAAEFRQAIQLSPGNPLAHFGYSLAYLTPLGRMGEAVDEMRLANDLDPLSPAEHTYLGITYYFGREYDAAIKEHKAALALDPLFPEALHELGVTYGQKRMFGEASAVTAKLATPGQAASCGMRLHEATLLAMQGKKAEALAVIPPIGPPFANYVRPTSLACVYAALRDKERTLAELERAYAEHDGMIAFLKVWPPFDFLHDDPRYQALLSKIGLTRQ